MDNQQKYLSGEKDATLFFDTFFSMCHKFKIDYEKANPKEKEFIDEMMRYNYELKKAKRDGLSTEKIEKPFPIEDSTLSEKLDEFLGDMRLTGFFVTRIILVKADDSRAFAERQGYNIVFRYAPYCGASGGVVCEPQIG